MIAARIALNKTAPDPRSFACLVKICQLGSKRSMIDSIELLIYSILMTKAIHMSQILHSMSEKPKNAAIRIAINPIRNWSWILKSCKIPSINPSKPNLNFDKNFIQILAFCDFKQDFLLKRKHLLLFGNIEMIIT